MSFFERLSQIVTLLQREGPVSYRALKREFGLDDDFLEDVKEERICRKLAFSRFLRSVNLSISDIRVGDFTPKIEICDRSVRCALVYSSEGVINFTGILRNGLMRWDAERILRPSHGLQWGVEAHHNGLRRQGSGSHFTAHPLSCPRLLER